MGKVLRVRELSASLLEGRDFVAVAACFFRAHWDGAESDDHGCKVEHADDDQACICPWSHDIGKSICFCE